MNFHLLAKLTKKSYPFVKPYMAKNILAIALNQISVVLTLLVPLLIQFLVDKVVVDHNYKQLTTFGVSLLAIYIFSSLCTFLSNYIYENFAERIVVDARSALYKRLLNMKMSFFVTEKIGDLVSRLRDDSTEIHSLLSFLLDKILINLLKLVVVFVIIFKMNSILGLVAFFSIPIFLGQNKYFGEKLRKQSHITRQLFADVMNFFVNSFTKILLIKNFSFEKQEVSQHAEISAKFQKSIILGEIYGSLNYGVTGLTIGISGVIVLWLGGYLVMQNSLTIGELIAFYTYMKMIYDPILTLAQSNVQINKTLASLERYFEYYEKTDIEDKESGLDIKLYGDITLSKVSFKYIDENIYKNTDLSIKAGQKVLFLGRSGQGKSTLAYLLKGFYQPQEGKILIDGLDITDISLNSLRKNIGYLSQEAFILDGTIGENLRCVKENATDEELWWALRQANIDNFVRTQLKNGLNENIGNNGANLSGGQRQRISIARLFLQNPNIVIFDELFTGLDIETEQSIWNNIKAFIKDKGVLFITHKIVEPEYFDLVCVVKNNTIKTYPNYERMLIEEGEDINYQVS